MIGPLRTYRNDRGDIVVRGLTRVVAVAVGDGLERERIHRFIESGGMWSDFPLVHEAAELIRREESEKPPPHWVVITASKLVIAQGYCACLTPDAPTGHKIYGQNPQPIPAWATATEES